MTPTPTSSVSAIERVGLVLEWFGWEASEWRGVAWSGVEWRGVAWSGVEWRGVAWSGVEWYVVQCNGWHRPGPNIVPLSW